MYLDIVKAEIWTLKQTDKPKSNTIDAEQEYIYLCSLLFYTFFLWVMYTIQRMIKCIEYIINLEYKGFSKNIFIYLINISKIRKMVKT